jgi:fused signal recognition particle receptor
MPEGVGFELITALALLGILITGGIVAWLRRGRTSEELSPSEVRGMRVSASADEDPRGLDMEEAAPAFGKDASLSLRGLPAVVMVVGEHGSGVTTMTGKLAYRLVNRGRLVAMTAIGGFHLPAVRELASWAERAGADLVSQEGAADPGAGAYHAVEVARARGSDVLIVDTSGGMQADRGSMEDLARVRRVLEKAAGRVDEVLLVLDASIDQSHTLISQARQFDDAAGVTGIALSKMDRSDEPRTALAALGQVGVSVKVVGTGENIEDLRGFDPTWFARALGETEAAGESRPTFGSPPGVSEGPPFAAES